MSRYPTPENDGARASTGNATPERQGEGEAPVDWAALEKLGWQQVVCPGCGGDYARARPVSALTPIPPAPRRPSTLGEQVAQAQAEVMTWSPEKRASVQLEGTDRYAHPPAPAARIPLLAKKHQGARVNYKGLLRQCQQSLAHSGDTGNAEMLRQLQEHLKELGERWYAGDTDVVDEILQLYCVEKDARAAHAANVSPKDNHD